MSYLAAFYATLLQQPTAIPYASSMLQARAMVVPNFNAGTTQDFTLEFWFAPTPGAPYCVPINSGGDGNSILFFMPHPNGQLYLDVGSWYAGGRLQANPPADIYQRFRHVAYVHDATSNQSRLYFDGELWASVNSTSAYSQTNGNYFQFLNDGCRIGEFRYWSAVRTQDQLKALKDVSVNGPMPDLLGSYRMDEQGGSGTLVRDRSGYAQHGQYI